MENRHSPQNIETGTFIQHADEVLIHHHVHMQPVPEPVPEAVVDQPVKEFCVRVKERSLKETSGGVADSYREQNLNEPVKKYTPQLKKIEFYRGDWVPKKKKTLQKHCQQYVKENVFALEEYHEEGEEISEHEILHFIEKRGTQRYKAIVGQAGSGKTTLMKRLARDVICGKLLIQKGQNVAFKPEFVHFLNIRDIPVTEEITPCDLLFRKVMAELDKDALEHGFKWLQKNQDRAVFFLDGLDQATWSLQGNSNPITYEDKASTSTIMENLLKGNLFPNVLIIISSREHSLSPLTGNLRPHEIIGLAGFTMEDRKQIFIGLAGEDGENLWNLMCTKSPALVPLASIPIFLVFIVIIYKFDPENPPDTMSGIMTKILQIFLQSDNAHEREYIMEILEGLKQMSFKGTEEGRVLFTHKDLEEFNLIPKKVRDLLVDVPGSTLLGKNLMKGDFRLFFCHQSIQELLSALSIIEKDLEEFTKFVNESLHEDHWSVVRRFVCGVLMNKETYAKDQDLIHVSDVANKRRILKQSLRKQLQSSTGQYRHQLELFASLYESNDSKFIQSDVHEINIAGQSLTLNDMHVISSILRRCSQVELVRLEKCNLNPETIEILNAGLQTSHLKIKSFDVSENKNMGTDGCKTIGAIVHRCQVEDLKMDCCNLSSDKIKGLQEGIANSKFKILDVKRNESMGTDGCKTIGAIVHRCQVEELKMYRCNLTTDKIKGLQEGLAKSKFKILDVSWNKKMGTDGCKTIGAIVRKCKVEVLKMWYSKLSTDEVKGLQEGLDNLECQIKILDFNGSENMGADGCKTIGAIVHKCQVEELNMSWCNLTIGEIKALQEGLADSKIKKLECSLALHHPPNESKGQVIADLVHGCFLQKFVLRNSQAFSSSEKDLIKQKAGDTEVIFE